MHVHLWVLQLLYSVDNLIPALTCSVSIFTGVWCSNRHEHETAISGAQPHFRGFKNTRSQTSFRVCITSFCFLLLDFIFIIFFPSCTRPFKGLGSVKFFFIKKLKLYSAWTHSINQKWHIYYNIYNVKKYFCNQNNNKQHNCFQHW